MSKVVSYDENKPSLTLANDEVHKADIIIAADGMPLLSLTSIPTRLC
jgi:salicylate hydroxylase